MSFFNFSPAPVPRDADIADIPRDIQEGALRAIIIGVGVVMVTWYLLANFHHALGDVVSVSVVLLVGAIFTTLAVLLMPRSLSAARLVWLVGIFLAGLVALAALHAPYMAYFLALIPLLAVTASFRWQWGLAFELGLTLLLALRDFSADLPVLSALPGFSLLPLLSSQPGQTIALLGAVLLVTGGIFAQSMLSLTRWSLSNYRTCRAELEALRNERVGLLQVQENFIQANNELARVSDRLAAMTQVAEEARRIKEDFVARVSHELRTPLNMVIGFSEVIMKSPQPYGDSIPSALLADVDAILRNSRHLSRLVDDILDLSQVEAGRMALTKEWTELSEVLGEAVSAVKGLFDSKGLYLRLDLAEALPPVFCDSTRIRQVIINLLGNAARFTEQGGVAIRVTRENNSIQISVSDSGPGISPADQTRVFEPFQQADSFIRRHKGGTGLGLTISKQFVEMHGGRMWLESQVGRGTTFSFTLPLTMVGDLGESENMQRWFNPYFQYEAPSQPANLPAPVFKRRYVLVENEDNLHRLLNRYVENLEVVGVRRIEDGIREVQRSPSQALILNTPANLDDPTIQEPLARLPFGTPVISCWLPGREEAARRLGVVDYLVKPVGREDVLDALGRVPGAKRVLLVDDEPEILRLFVRMISSADASFSMIQAMNGRRALQLLRSRKPDVVLLDLVMPEMDGYQVLEEKSRDPEIRDIPVIVVSSQNPNGEANVSKTLSITRGDGLSIRELLTCIQSVTGILVPEERTADRAPGESPVVKPAS